MKIYLQDLGKYNNGCSLCGEWLDLEQLDEEELKEKYDELVDDEFIILDWEYGDDNEKIFFKDIEGQYADPFKLLERQELINNLNKEDKLKLSYLIDYQGESFDIAIDIYKEIIYQEDDLQDVAKQFLEESLGEKFEIVEDYIDYDKYIKFLEMDGYAEYKGKVFYPY